MFFVVARYNLPEELVEFGPTFSVHQCSEWPRYAEYVEASQPWWYL